MQKICVGKVIGTASMGGREGGREGRGGEGRGGEGGWVEMTVIHILMAPRYLYNNRFTYYVIT